MIREDLRAVDVLGLHPVGAGTHEHFPSEKTLTRSRDVPQRPDANLRSIPGNFSLSSKLDSDGVDSFIQTWLGCPRARGF